MMRRLFFDTQGEITYTAALKKGPLINSILRGWFEIFIDQS